MVLLYLLKERTPYIIVLGGNLRLTGACDGGDKMWNGRGSKWELKSVMINSLTSRSVRAQHGHFQLLSWGDL
jgi:hypothetical protein